MKNKVDYIIVGQGIAGTWLSHELISRGYDVVIFNHETANTSSNKAAGLYNPITGRKMMLTWKAGNFFPSLEENYQKLEAELGERFLHPIPMYRPFKSIEDQNDWQGKQEENVYLSYLQKFSPRSLEIENIKDPYGGIILSHTGYVDLPRLINAFRSYLKDKGHYISEMFSEDKLYIDSDKVKYENWEAKKVIFCEIVHCFNFFNFRIFYIII